MKRMTKIAATALLAGSVFSLTATGIALAHGAQRGGGPSGVMAMEFADLDGNGDGQITVDDLLAQAQARFAAADSNGDGTLDPAEMLAQAEARMAERKPDAQEQRGPNRSKRAAWAIERMIANRDQNGDGVLSLEEMVPLAGMERMIDRFDTDDDNAVSEAEFDVAQKEIFDRRGGKRGPGRKAH